jgi:hypothetical protein
MIELFLAGVGMVAGSILGIERLFKQAREERHCMASRSSTLSPKDSPEIHYHITLDFDGAERIGKRYESIKTDSRVYQQLGEEFRLLLESDQEIKGGYGDKAHSSNHHRSETPDAYQASFARINRNA